MKNTRIQLKSDQHAEGIEIDPEQDDQERADGTIEHIILGKIIYIKIEPQGDNDDQQRCQR